MGIDGGLPLEPLSPNINADLLVIIEQKPGERGRYRIQGKHDGFPNYELYIHGKPAYLHDVLATNQTPVSLLPPMEFEVNTPWVNTPWVNLD